jgi:hypothetical protein
MIATATAAAAGGGRGRGNLAVHNVCTHHVLTTCTQTTGNRRCAFESGQFAQSKASSVALNSSHVAQCILTPRVASLQWIVVRIGVTRCLARELAS